MQTSPISASGKSTRPCRLDNGRALRQLAKKPGASHAFIQFTTGEVYRISPVFDWELRTIATLDLKPGCWFNKIIRKRRNYAWSALPAWPDDVPQDWNHIYWGDTGYTGQVIVRIHPPGPEPATG